MKLQNVTKTKIWILVFTILYTAYFLFLSGRRGNIEFIFYGAVLVVFALFFLGLNHYFNLSWQLLLALSGWGFIHMAGGNIIINNEVLYGYWFIENVFRYDHFAHAYGFYVATITAFYTLQPSITKKKKLIAVPVLLVFIGMGLGSLNELIEYAAVLIFPETGVGGYTNTLNDMVANTVGAIGAVFYLLFRGKLKN